MDNLEYFYLSPKESREMIEFLAKKRNIKLRTINVNRVMNYCRL